MYVKTRALLVDPALLAVDFVDGLGGGIVDLGLLGRASNGHVLLVNQINYLLAL